MNDYLVGGLCTLAVIWMWCKPYRKRAEYKARMKAKMKRVRSKIKGKL